MIHGLLVAADRLTAPKGPTCRDRAVEFPFRPVPLVPVAPLEGPDELIPSAGRLILPFNSFQFPSIRSRFMACLPLGPCGVRGPSAERRCKGGAKVRLAVR